MRSSFRALALFVVGWVGALSAWAVPPSLNGINGGGLVELGQQVTLTVSFSGSGTGQTYAWRKNGVTIAGATAVSYGIAAAVADDAGAYSVTVTNVDGSSVASTDLTVKPLAPPVITIAPRTTVAQVGQQVVFTYTATGSFPRTHQWRRDGVAIPGATQATYTINAVTTADAATYSVVVSNSEGSVTSASASLTVNAATPPIISSGSPFDNSVTAGQQVSISVSLISGSSPFTYQWMKNGSAISGATNSSLAFPAVALADAGRYSVMVSNVAGSATSREAVLTVNPPTPITIFSHPSSQTLSEGQPLSLSISINGSSPITYQWLKNGAPIAGATNSSFSISAVGFADAGSYAVVLTNAAGSVTTNPAVVTVNPATAPTITTQPSAPAAISFNGFFSLSVQAGGSSPFTYQWRKDGTPISGATSSNYSVSTATPAHSGSYTVVVSNRAGSVTSVAVTVTVAAPVLATITTQPADVQAPIGLSAEFQVRTSSTGTGNLTFQWLKNGGPIANATSTNYGITSVRESDAGLYSVVITGAAGSVTSAAARLTVLPPSPPSVGSWPSSISSTAFGSRASFTLGSIGGTGPFTFQWSRNGVPIPGATDISLVFPALSAADLGTYTVTISNEGGVITSPALRVSAPLSLPTFGSPSPLPWLDSGRVGDILYFLATGPGRIERYDLAGERWLPTVILSDTQVPTAFVPATEGVYVAYGRTVARRTLDLATETPLTNAASAVSQMFVFGDFLYCNSGPSGASSSFGAANYSSLRRSSLQAGPAVSIGSFYGPFRQIALAPSIGKGFGRSTSISPADILMFSIAADGRVSGETDAPYHGTMPVGSRPIVLPGEQLVADDAGTVYRTSNLTYAGSFGEAFSDLAFFADGTPVVLRGLQLTTTRADTFAETGRTSISAMGLRLFTRGSDAFVFSAASSATQPFTVTKVSAADFRPAVSTASTAVPSGRYAIDDAFLGDNNILHVFSRTLQGLVRWDPATRTFLSTLPLRDVPSRLVHQPGNRRALAYYADGVVTEIPLNGTGTERILFPFGHFVRGITDLGDMVMVNLADAQDSGDQRVIFGASGGPRFINTSLYEGTGLAWQAASRRLYSTPAFSSGLQYEVVTTAGALGATGTSGQTGGSVGTVTPPIRFNSEGTLLVSRNGRVLNADLASLGVLANDIIDAAWLGNSLYTIRSRDGGTQVQQWARSTYLQAGTVAIRGTPVRLFRLSDAQLLVVSSDRGYLALTLVNSDLSLPSNPAPQAFAGVYFATLGPTAGAGDVALLMRADGSGVLLAHLSASRVGLLATNVALNADGTFIVGARDLASGSSRTVAGALSSSGMLTGSIPSLNLTFSGARATGSGTPGYYAAVAVNGASGSAHAIIGPNGRGVVVAQNASTVEGGAAAAAGANFVTTTATGVTLTFAVNDGTGSVSASAGSGSLAGIVFAGLRDDVARSDRLANISTRGRVGGADDAMIAGFVISGSAPRPVLVRAIGPALANFGLVGTLADPKLTLFRGGTQLMVSDDWSAEAAANSIVSTSARLGAFGLPNPGRDAVVLATLDPGSYTAQVTPASGGPGVALVEVYDAGDDAVPAAPRLINIATRGRVGTGENVLIAGIVVTGNAPKRLLIRGVGPALGTFGITDALADPVLTLQSGQTTLQTNDDWWQPASGLTSSDLSAAAVSVGAFALPISSRDACLLLTLQPGNYTAQVTGKNGTAGVALIEVYELPQ